MEKDYLNRTQLYSCYTYINQIKKGMKHRDLLPVVIISIIGTKALPDELPWSEMKEIAKDNYDYWFGRGKGFLKGATTYLNDLEYALSAFSLHQATESFYSTIFLLVFSNYKPKLDDIKKLGSRVRKYHIELLQVFPMATPEQEECFKLLQKAYVDARYDKNYKITKEQLLYLIERIEKLKEITERICTTRINQ
ncbi:nucleotidyltransferase [Rickettsia endosymbiont of Ixodes scapularis]|nr:nucleotidyltransferase [Rickettsia endosymbiont of Ixodes scapularis]